MSIGTTIKKLRRERDMTQETLAEYLGITANAVSQWECDRTAPDISQLPLLANIFEVTADHLLGIDVACKQENIEHICNEAWDACNAGDKIGAVRIIRDGLAFYPNNFKLMCDLTVFLYQRAFHQKCPENERKELCAEIAALIDKILADCNDMKICSMAVELACQVFPMVGRRDDAIRLLDNIPDVSKGELLLSLYKGDDLEYHLKSLISKAVSFAADQTAWLASLENSNGSPIYNNDTKLLLYNKAISFYKILYEAEDFYFDAESLAEAEKRIANIFASRGDVNNTIMHLKECIRYAIMFDTYDEIRDTYSSVILCGRHPDGINRNYEWNKSHEMLMRLNNDTDYDFVRDKDEFKNIIEQLEQTDNMK